MTDYTSWRCFILKRLSCRSCLDRLNCIVRWLMAWCCNEKPVARVLMLLFTSYRSLGRLFHFLLTKIPHKIQHEADGRVDIQWASTCKVTGINSAPGVSSYHSTFVSSFKSTECLIIKNAYRFQSVFTYIFWCASHNPLSSRRYCPTWQKRTDQRSETSPSPHHSHVMEPRCESKFSESQCSSHWADWPSIILNWYVTIERIRDSNKASCSWVMGVLRVPWISLRFNDSLS